jgi:outer membrane immunogenic protein
MKKHLFRIVAFAALASAPAMAADLPMRAARAPAQVATNWTGFYLNAGWGYGMWVADTQTVNSVTGTCVLCVEQRQGGRGWLGTFGGGFDFQVGQNIVVGALADFDFADIKGDIQDQGPFTVARVKEKWAWAAGARIGWLVTPGLLSYVNGGFTEARFRGGEAINTFSGLAQNRTYQSFTTQGWFIGGGVDYQLTSLFGIFGPGWFWRNEYRFAQYDKKDFVSCNDVGGLCGSAFSSSSIRFDPVVQTIRSELVWKFNFGKAPVVASY